MSAIAQSQSTTSLPIQSRSHQNGRHTAVLATAATLAGAILLAATMTLSAMLAGQLREFDVAPMAEPMPQPSTAQAL